MRGLLFLMITTLALAGAEAAHGAAWEHSFAPAAVGALTIPGRARITLVAAGEGSAALDEARGVLAAAIKASGVYTLVDGDLVRDLAPAVNDAEVLRRERYARHVEAIWILRVAPAELGSSATAALRIYAPLGPLLREVYVTEGVPMPVVAGEPDLAGEYLRQRISPVVGGRVATEAGDEAFVRAGGFAKDGLKLERPRDLYVALGRYDLLGRHDSVDDDRELATIVSGAVVFVGAVLFMQDVFDDGGTPSLELGALGISGIVAGGLGAVGLLVARLIDPDPLDWSGKVDAARSYNGDLKRRLDTPANDAGGARSGRARVTSLGVTPFGEGLSLTLGGVF